MADFIPFPEADTLLKAVPKEGEVSAPDGSVVRDGVTIHALPVWHKGEREFVSCWQFSAEEMLEIMHTGRVWLHVLGSLSPPSHPPVYISGNHPSGKQFVPLEDLIKPAAGDE